MSLMRETMQLVELDVDTCDNSYGQANVPGRQLIVDPRFEYGLGSSWLSGAGWNVVPGAAIKDADGTGILRQLDLLTIGETYEITFTLTNVTAGEIRALCGATTGTSRSTNGTFTEQLVCTTSGRAGLRPLADNFRGTVTLVEFRRVGSCSAVFGAQIPGPNGQLIDTSRKCFNTFFTCQAKADYFRTTKTLTFGKNISGLPKGQTIYPALVSVSTSPTQITLGATDDRLGTFGKRARVKVKFRDFVDNDNGFDKYADERRTGAAQQSGVGYEPQDRGTFFTRLRARWPYYNKRKIRIKNGFVGDDINSIPAREYIITELDGPDAQGNVSKTAQDPLILTDKKLAQCPKPNNGRLTLGVTAAVGQTIELKPAGIGDQEYAASGWASIGKEIVQFTRSSDTVTLTSRGEEGTQAEAHSPDDTFQEAYRVENGRVDLVAADLLTTYAGIDASAIPSTDWEDETIEWMSGMPLNRTIAKPQPVLTLMSELAALGISWWWDDEAQEIKMRANRPVWIDEPVYEVSDDATILEKTGAPVDLDDQRLSQAWVYHSVISFGEEPDKSSEFRKLNVTRDGDAESENEYDQTRITEIFMPWFGLEGNDIQARIAANKMVAKFRDTPKSVEFVADYKDKDNLAIGNIVRLTSRLIVDQTGQAQSLTLQVVSVDEFDPGNRLRIKAESNVYSGRFAGVAENSVPDYNSATGEQKATSAFISADTNIFPDGSGAYQIF